ncbi:GTPase domain-containing protein, partial [Acidobacteriota bacterium]
METMDKLHEINEALQDLLATPTKAALAQSHPGDDLMVWFLLGGKDVGKSTFLNALLGTAVSAEPQEEAEGTSRFVAYIHKTAVQELQSRLADLSIAIRYHTHESEPHRRLCLIDSPDFDSRYDRHVNQVRMVLDAGVSDGVVLLASPAKYKDEEYWGTFAKLEGVLSSKHILFTLTKADELGNYIDAARADFKKTIERRMTAIRGSSRKDGGPVYAINSPERSIDFSKLEARLLRKLSIEDVRNAQEENRRHALVRAAGQIRKHHRLDELRTNLQAARDPARLEEVFEDHFPSSFFHSVASRLSNNRGVTGVVHE